MPIRVVVSPHLQEGLLFLSRMGAASRQAFRVALRRLMPVLERWRGTLVRHGSAGVAALRALPVGRTFSLTSFRQIRRRWRHLVAAMPQPIQAHGALLLLGGLVGSAFWLVVDLGGPQSLEAFPQPVATHWRSVDRTPLTGAPTVTPLPLTEPVTLRTTLLGAEPLRAAAEPQPQGEVQVTSMAQANALTPRATDTHARSAANTPIDAMTWQVQDSSGFSPAPAADAAERLVSRPQAVAAMPMPGGALGMEGAASVVYVIDAAGSAVDTLPLALGAVQGAISELRSSQRFTVIAFQGDGWIEAFPGRGLQAATPDARHHATQWLHPQHGPVRAHGRGSWLAAMRQAWAYQPQMVFVLADSPLAPSAGPLDQQRLLETLAAEKQTLSPTSRISVVELVYPDPQRVTRGGAGTLEKLAGQHGGEYRFMSSLDGR